jgi:hypothetical protein
VQPGNCCDFFLHAYFSSNLLIVVSSKWIKTIQIWLNAITLAGNISLQEWVSALIFRKFNLCRRARTFSSFCVVAIAHERPSFNGAAAAPAKPDPHRARVCISLLLRCSCCLFYGNVIRCKRGIRNSTPSKYTHTYDVGPTYVYDETLNLGADFALVCVYIYVL